MHVCMYVCMYVIYIYKCMYMVGKGGDTFCI